MATLKKSLRGENQKRREDEIKKKKERDRMIFASLKLVAHNNKMFRLSERATSRIYESIGLQPPDVPRTKDIREKVSFVVGVGRMFLYLHTGYNPRKGEFPEDGALSIVIVDPFDEKQRVFYRQLKQIPGVDRKVEDHLEFFLKELSPDSRPVLKGGGWASILEVTQDQFYWVDKKQAIIRGLFENADPRSWVSKIQKQKEGYEFSTRVNKKISVRRRDIKKPYKTKK